MKSDVSSHLADAGLHLTTGEALAPRQWIPGTKERHGFPSLDLGQIHEFHFSDHLNQQKSWHPPLTFLAAMALSAGAKHRVLWVGRRCWPTFQLLHALEGDEFGRGALALSTFLDPLTDVERFWAIGQGLRCAGVGCVVADGGGMTGTVSRRLQLAAESGKVLGLIARPAWELGEPSHAATRWRVETRESQTGLPRWGIELDRCRGRQPGQDAPRRWIVEWAYQVFRGTGALHFSADLGCGRGAAPETSGQERRTA